ncbi:MAG: hypothetical protein HY698_04110 [Deltaproteobacteria bacterium]|nr:hypothetical protein [Deltaproteobacteria bacterium]
MPRPCERLASEQIPVTERLLILPLYCLCSAPALAAPVKWTLGIEAGSELDTNVHRVEYPRPGESQYGVEPAIGGKAALRLSLRAKPVRGHATQLSTVLAGRKFAPSGQDANEDMGVISLDAQHAALLGDAPLRAFASLSYYDSFQRDSLDGVRSADGSLGLTLVGEGDHRVTTSFGMQLFHFKPDPTLDFEAMHAGLRYGHVFFAGPEDDSPAYDFGLEYAVHRRALEIPSLVNTCPPEKASTPDGKPDPSCRRATGHDRRDLFHSAAVELRYTGSRIFSARYDLMVNDSTSYGESLRRHRLTLSATTRTFLDVFFTVKTVLQKVDFVDSLLVSRGIGSFVVQDEGRNALLVQLTKDIGDNWSVEGRYAAYARAFLRDSSVSYLREVFYLGLAYTITRN